MISPWCNIVYERAADGGWGAFTPEVPGVGVIGDSFDETRELILKALSMHLVGMVQDGHSVPAHAYFNEIFPWS